MADDVTAILAAIRERNEHLRSRYGYVGGLLALTGAKDDVPHLVAAVEGALKLADKWDVMADRLGTHHSRHRAFKMCADEVREAITAALAGTGKEGSEDG